MFQAHLLRQLQLFVRVGRAAGQAQIGGEEFGGAQQHAVVQARTEITDGGAGRHGDQQGEEQYAQFPGAGITQQLAAGQGQQAGQRHMRHQGSTRSTRWPPSRRIRRWQRCARRSSWVTSTRVAPCS